MSVNDRAVMVFLPSEQHKIIYSQNSHSLNKRSQAHLQNLSQLSDDFAEKHWSHGECNHSAESSPVLHPVYFG